MWDEVEEEECDVYRKGEVGEWADRGVTSILIRIEMMGVRSNMYDQEGAGCVTSVEWLWGVGSSSKASQQANSIPYLCGVGREM